jgi:hypothetical protein
MAIGDINTIELQGNVILKNGKPITIRGPEGNTSNANKKRWQEPLQNFKIVDARNGKAEMILTSISPPEARGIESVARNSSYVVEEIRFVGNKIEIQAIPR